MPVALNDKRMKGVELITRLNAIAGSHGVGRIDIIEDRVLGLKARENYECPAAVVLLSAHMDLERLVLSRKELRFKESVDAVWGELVYHGLWNEPLREDLDAFIDKTQGRVTGIVEVELKEGAHRVVARNSRHGLFSEKDVSFDDKTLDQREVEGMLKYHSYQAALYEKNKRK